MGEESLGAYVISMSKRPSDVLAVKLLMKEFGLKRCVRWMLPRLLPWFCGIWMDGFV